MSEPDKHWLVRRKTIRWLWIAFLCLLAATLGAGLFVHQHEVFGIEGGFGFYSWFGFLSCVMMVVFSKLLGIFLKRPEGYYRPPPEQPPLREQSASGERDDV